MASIDSHCHLDFVEDLGGALERAKAEGLGKIITIGTSLECSKKCIEIAEKYSNDDLQIYATCGLHPKDAKGEVDRLGVNESIHRLKSIARSSSKVVGIGEAGLDYYLGPRVKGLGTSEEEKIQQRELFEAQIRLADELNLPLVIHCRNGWGEIFRLLTIDDGRSTNLKGVFHSFTGDWNAAQRALDLGFYISFSGIVTFKQSLRSSSFDKLRTAGLKNAAEIQEVAQKMPIDRMLVETDSPFLTPEPYRSSVNEPKNVKMIARFIADLRKSSLDTIEETMTKNAQDLFKI